MMTPTRTKPIPIEPDPISINVADENIRLVSRIGSGLYGHKRRPHGSGAVANSPSS